MTPYRSVCWCQLGTSLPSAVTSPSAQAATVHVRVYVCAYECYECACVLRAISRPEWF